MYLTFLCTNEAKVVDRDTRLRIAMPATQAARLWHELGAQRSHSRIALEVAFAHK